MKNKIKPRLRNQRLYGIGLWLVSAGILSSLSSVQAAPASLGWQAAVVEANRNNAELKAAQANLHAANANVQVARSSYLPTVNASLSTGIAGNDTSEGSQRRALSDQLEGKATQTYGAALEASETIFDGFATQSRVGQAKARVTQSEQQLTLLKARLSFDLKSAYSGMMQAQRSLRLYQDIIKRREENLRLVELRFDSGQENKGAVRLSEAYLKQARYEESQARDSLNVSRARLNAVLGRADDNSYELKDDVPITDVPVKVDFPALARATPDFKLTQAQETEATSTLSLARSGFYPKLGLKGSIGRQDDHFFPDNESWSVTLTLTVPLFSGGSDYYTKQAATDSLTAAGLNKDTAERNIVGNLKQAYVGVVQAAEKLNVDISFQEASTMRAEIARSKYNNGLTTFDDWDIIENDLITRQRSVLSSQGNRVVAEATWEQAQGKGALQ